MQTFAAFIGALLGFSVSIEMLMVVFAVVYLGNSTARYFVALPLGVVAFVSLRIALLPDMSQLHALAAASGVILWSNLGAAIRSRRAARAQISN